MLGWGGRGWWPFGRFGKMERADIVGDELATLSNLLHPGALQCEGPKTGDPRDTLDHPSSPSLTMWNGIFRATSIGQSHAWKPRYYICLWHATIHLKPRLSHKMDASTQSVKDGGRQDSVRKSPLTTVTEDAMSEGDQLWLALRWYLSVTTGSARRRLESSVDQWKRGQWAAQFTYCR
jgi:hypothetical protein